MVINRARLKRPCQKVDSVAARVLVDPTKSGSVLNIEVGDVIEERWTAKLCGAEIPFNVRFVSHESGSVNFEIRPGDEPDVSALVTPPPPIPKNSSVMTPPGSAYVTGKKAYLLVRLKVMEKYNCAQFTIDKVDKIDGGADFEMDKDGRISRGKIAEWWHLTACGSPRTIGIEATPYGNGGVSIAIGVID